MSGGTRSKMDILYQDVMGDIQELVEKIESLQKEIPGVTGQAVKQLLDAAANLKDSAAAAEADKLQIAFTKVAENVLQDIRREAHAAAPSAWKIKVSISLSILAIICASAGAVIGSFYKSEEETRQIAAGKDFLQVLPQLDQQTRDKIAKLIEKNR